ncbi:MAG: glycosyltransferase, partial [Candidatus Latescibacteria bacterium]|nr:glycosyltransferase [bacterium]MBD3424546.1 glycosyltransferase [Candidatus Latescibacterota bacterium]
MKEDRTVSVVIPTYNEEQSLGELYRRMKDMLNDFASSHELIFIDDGSTDGSLDILHSLREKDRAVKIISFQRNYGKSAALSEGFKVASCNYVVTIDADLQDNPDEIPEMIELLEEGADLVSGWKVNRQDPITKTLPSRIFNLVTSMVSKIKLHDFNCGLKAYRQEVVKNISVYGELHRFIPVLAAWEGYSITEKKVSHFERKFGRSKYGVRRFLNGFFDLMTVMFITRRASSPLHFFGRVAFLFFAIGGLINLYFLIKWLGGGGLHVRPIMVGGMIM